MSSGSDVDLFISQLEPGQNLTTSFTTIINPQTTGAQTSSLANTGSVDWYTFDSPDASHGSLDDDATVAIDASISVLLSFSDSDLVGTPVGNRQSFAAVGETLTVHATAIASPGVSTLAMSLSVPSPLRIVPGSARIASVGDAVENGAVVGPTGTISDSIRVEFETGPPPCGKARA